MKPTTYRAGFQRPKAVDVHIWQGTLASAGGGLSRAVYRSILTHSILKTKKGGKEQ